MDLFYDFTYNIPVTYCTIESETDNLYILFPCKAVVDKWFLIEREAFIQNSKLLFYPMIYVYDWLVHSVYIFHLDSALLKYSAVY